MQFRTEYKKAIRYRELGVFGRQIDLFWTNLTIDLVDNKRSVPDLKALEIKQNIGIMVLDQIWGGLHPCKHWDSVRELENQAVI